MENLFLNAARTVARSTVNGPGERFVIWVQGCSLHCSGCWNFDTWNKKPRHMVTVTSLVDEVLQLSNIEGVTLTGGEPFEQSTALLEFVQRVRPVGLSVMAFTGYELNELTQPQQQKLLGLCDIVVAGRYEKELKRTGHPWCSSTNQRVHFVSSRYDTKSIPNEISCEIHLDTDGSMTITGFPSSELIASLQFNSKENQIQTNVPICSNLNRLSHPNSEID